MHCFLHCLLHRTTFRKTLRIRNWVESSREPGPKSLRVDFPFSLAFFANFSFLSFVFRNEFMDFVLSYVNDACVVLPVKSLRGRKYTLVFKFLLHNYASRCKNVVRFEALYAIQYGFFQHYRSVSACYYIGVKFISKLHKGAMFPLFSRKPYICGTRINLYLS